MFTPFGLLLEMRWYRIPAAEIHPKKRLGAAPEPDHHHFTLNRVIDHPSE